MDFYNFSRFLVDHQEHNLLPDAFRYPAEVNLSSEIWQSLIKLFEFTKPYNIEYAVSFFALDNDIVVTPITKGNDKEVITRTSVNLSYKQISKDFAEKLVFINGKIIKRSQLKLSQVNKAPEIHPLFLVHSHPRQIYNGKSSYSFFSDTDLNSLKDSSFLCTGLVTDELFLICKHSKSNFDFDNLKLINNKYFFDKEISLKDTASLGFVIYRAEFNKKLVRLNS